MHQASGSFTATSKRPWRSGTRPDTIHPRLARLNSIARSHNDLTAVSELLFYNNQQGPMGRQQGALA